VDCGEDLYDKELDGENLRVAYDLYRQKHNVLTPAEIREMREGYDLSQRGLGTLLGWGEITIHRYENGNIPDEAHNQMLTLIRDPFVMERILENSGQRLHAAARQRLGKRLREKLSQRVPEKVIQVLEQSTSGRKPDIFTGFREFSSEALMEMMVFFAAKPLGVLKTKLNKLIWYSDFLHFRRYSVSMSGAPYVHLPFGPVPNQYGLYLSSLNAIGTLNCTEMDFGDDIIGENLEATRSFESEALPETAGRVLEAVHRRFMQMSSREISRVSHEEDGYKNTQPGEFISYEYAEMLKIDIPLEE
jgi:putative zinc finger/helix-turn-helix YgiT family protein